MDVIALRRKIKKLESIRDKSSNELNSNRGSTSSLGNRYQEYHKSKYDRANKAIEKIYSLLKPKIVKEDSVPSQNILSGNIDGLGPPDSNEIGINKKLKRKLLFRRKALKTK